MVRGQEQQFESTIDHLIEYSKNIKDSLIYFLHRIESEGDAVEWPQVLDSFTSIRGQINTLMRFTREHRSQFLENRAVLPLLLTPERDEELAKLTAGRVQLVNHEMVPDYLRTKPDPEIEEHERNLQTKASFIGSDATGKQISAMNKLVDNTINIIKASSARVDSEMARQGMKSSFNSSDTNEILVAVSTGKGLRVSMPQSHRGGVGISSGGLDSMLPMRIPEPSISIPPGGAKQNVKAPELKTNIKTGL